MQEYPESYDDHDRLCEEVERAYQGKSPINIVGGNSKHFYGRERIGRTLEVSRHKGIVHYEPSELVITARCGTPLNEITRALAEQNQTLAFEPPSFGQNATIGGTIACGLSGPRRPYSGAIRDNILGLHIINGKGEYLKFGGEVMKNVAGYDVSRLNCGAQGTLGVITQVSLKVQPLPKKEMTLALQMSADRARVKMIEWMAKPWPISATFYDGRNLYVRLSGIQAAIEKLQQEIGGDVVQNDDLLWINIREHNLDFFQSDNILWRISVPITAPELSFASQSVMEWNGGLRWIRSKLCAQDIYQATALLGGHATQFRHGVSDHELFQPLLPQLKTLHKRVKHAFDPENILNPARMYSWC